MSFYWKIEGTWGSTRNRLTRPSSKLYVKLWTAIESYYSIEKYIGDRNRGKDRIFDINWSGLPADWISESMTVHGQGQGEKVGRKGMNNRYLSHDGQWDLHRSCLAGSVDGDDVLCLRIVSADLLIGVDGRQ